MSDLPYSHNETRDRALSSPQSKLPSTPEGLLAERDRLETLLQASEEWRALSQLRARAGRGEKLTSVSEGQIEALLFDALAGNPFYTRHAAVQREIDRLKGEAPGGGGGREANIQQSAVDNLKRIRRIDADTERRLHAINVWSFEQIRDWTSADVKNVAGTLAIGNRISAENWIEQAALLGAGRPPWKATPIKAAAGEVTPDPEPTPEPQPGVSAQTTSMLQTPAVDPPRPLPARNFLVASASTGNKNLETVAAPPVVVKAAIAEPEAAAEPLAAVEPLSVNAPEGQAAATTVIEEETQIDEKAQIDDLADFGDTGPRAVPPDPEWVKQQIATLEAQLLDIAYGPNDAQHPQDTSAEMTEDPFDAAGEAEADIRIVNSQPRESAQAPAPEPPPLPAAAAQSVDARLSGLLGREDYAAFRSSVEEATVEIVRRNGKGTPPELPPAMPAAAALPPAYPWPLEEPRDDSASEGSASRFSKALTGS